MKVVIIGNKGFIGTWVEKYLATKYEVWGCDVVADHGAKKYFMIDPSNADFIEVFTKQSFDLCINCAGAANVSDSFIHPKRDFLLNTCHVFYLLDAIRQLQPNCRFLQLSSAAVYGNPSLLPIDESATSVPISPYGWHKYQAELLCKEYYEVYGIPTISARIFSAYGPGLKKQLFWDLYQKAKQGQEVPVYGTGNETRDFIYVSDLALALEAIALKGDFKGEVINVANGKQISIKEASNTFLKKLGKGNETRFNNQVKEGDPLYWEADITQLTSMGYVSKFSLEEGLEQYANWVKALAD